VTEETSPQVTRRRLIGVGAGAAVVGAVAGVGGAYAATHLSDDPAAAGDPASDDSVPFRGERQAGIITPAQDRMHFVALDVVTENKAALADMLKAWTRAAERMTAGAEAAPGGVVGGGPYRAPEDTGEAYDLDASDLTITIGYGPSLFDDRFGLADRKPAALEDLPGFVGDDLDPARSGGDLCIQACANDPQVAVHAIRHLVRMGFGTTAVRWSQLGFGRTSSTSTTQATMRNMFGFKDGTRNIKAEDPAALRDHVWAAPGDGPEWMTGGSYLVARRIRMHIEIWDRTSLNEQESIVGRLKGSGAAPGRAGEFDEPDFVTSGNDGRPLLGDDAHIRLASAEANGGVKILRRGYNFVDGADGAGHLDAGLFFVGFMRDPHKQFVPLQRALAKSDRMMEYIEHTGSASFAVPPGVRRGGHWGDTLFT
jgi:deferrochelatase/peroxidase EfeB